MNCGKVVCSVQSNLLPNNEPEVVNTECNMCFSVLDLPKATVTHARVQELGETSNSRYDGGIDGYATIGYDCNSLSDSANVVSIRSLNSGTGSCGPGSGQYSMNVLGVALPCQHICNYESICATMSDSIVVGGVGATNGQSVSIVGQTCHASDKLDRVDFFRNWGRVADNTRLVYLHGLNNPDRKGFYLLHSDHSGPTLALTACRNQVGYLEVEFSEILYVHICEYSLITEYEVVRAKQAYNDYTKEQFIKRTCLIMSTWIIWCSI